MSKQDQDKLRKALWILFESQAMEEAFRVIEDAKYEPKTHIYFNLILAVWGEVRMELPRLLRGDLIGDNSEDIQRCKNMLSILRLYTEEFEGIISGYEYIQEEK